MKIYLVQIVLSIVILGLVIDIHDLSKKVESELSAIRILSTKIADVTELIDHTVILTNVIANQLKYEASISQGR